MKSFFYSFERFVRNLAKTDKKASFLGIENHWIIFFNFFHSKLSDFASNLNDDFYKTSFEDYYVSLSQKLAILGFLPKIIFILVSVTSETSWGQTMSFSDLTEVSNLAKYVNFDMR